MTTAAERAAYPLSGPQGESIPHDVGDPQGLLIVAVTTGASSTEKNIPTDYEIITLYSTVECLVGFDTAAAIDLTQNTHKEDHIILPAKTPTTIRNRWSTLRTYGTGTSSGVLYLQKWRRWEAAQSADNISRIG